MISERSKDYMVWIDLNNRQGVKRPETRSQYQKLGHLGKVEFEQDSLQSQTQDYNVEVRSSPSVDTIKPLRALF